MAERSELEERIEYERRLGALENDVESLKWHHRNDNVLPRLNELEKDVGVLLSRPVNNNIQPRLSELEKDVGVLLARPVKPNGNGAGSGSETDKRLRWLERIVWAAVGGVAAFEFFIRVFKH